MITWSLHITNYGKKNKEEAAFRRIFLTHENLGDSEGQYAIMPSDYTSRKLPSQVQ